MRAPRRCSTGSLREFSADELPADFVPYDAAEVARHRHAALVDVGAARRELLRALDGLRSP